MGIRREDFREVRPTPEEKAAWDKKEARHGRAGGYPYRAECRRCGERIWYSGLGIGSHLRSRKHRESRA